MSWDDLPVLGGPGTDRPERAEPPPPERPRPGRLGLDTPLWVRVLVLALPLFTAILCLAAERHVRSANAEPLPLLPTEPYREAIARLSAWGVEVGLPADRVPFQFRFRSGETLAAVLGDLGLEAEEVYAATSAAAERGDLRRLRAGDHYTVFVDRERRPTALEMRMLDEGVLAVERSAGRWSSRWRPFVRSTQVRSISGELEGSLEGSIQRAGGQTTLAVAMSDVLQWDLDFNRDLRLGDRFEILYELVLLDGELDSLGAILAMTYENMGKVLEAYRFGEDGGYYDSEGQPLRKMFLRSPLPYSRVTSRFSNRRFHPILKRYRPHYGVDYGAPTGTPVRVTASGVVTFAGWDQGGGRMVKVRHPNSYLTAYLHLSGFAKGVRSGRRVSQGQVIGYVGSTGLSTGPHLDYRVQRGGRWIDPLSLKNLPADPIAEEMMPAFRAHLEELRRGLSQRGIVRLALAAPTDGEMTLAGLDPAAGAPPAAQ